MANINPFAVASESFKTPYGYESYIKAQASAANKRISDMDMFYANLDEATRQFDETLGFKVETRDMELDWERERWEEELGFKEKSLAADISYKNSMIGIENRKLRLLEEQAEGKDEMEEEAFDFFKDYMKKEQSATLDVEKHGVYTSGPWGPEVEAMASGFIQDVRGEGVEVEGSGIVPTEEVDWRAGFLGGGSSTDPHDPNTGEAIDDIDWSGWDLY